jgi:hypothetical protein
MRDGSDALLESDAIAVAEVPPTIDVSVRLMVSAAVNGNERRSVVPPSAAYANAAMPLTFSRIVMGSA